MFLRRRLINTVRSGTPGKHLRVRSQAHTEAANGLGNGPLNNPMEKTTQFPIITLTRDSRIDTSNLELIQNLLSGNELAIRYIPDMLRYANSLLIASERRCRTPYDQPLAEVVYGNTTFLFSRSSQLRGDTPIRAV